MTIIEKISAARSTFFRANGFLPNTVRINMADYRQLCEWARLARHVVINPATGEATILNPIPEKLDKIFGMRIVKRAGEMECVFDAALNSARNLLNAGLTGIESRKQINAEIDAIVSNGDKSGRPFVMKRDHSLCRHDIPAINCTECFVAPKIDLRDAIKRDDPTGGYGTCVHGNDFMACAKCIPPISKREFSGVPDTIKISMVNITPLAEWFRNQTAKEFEKLRFKFEQRIPNIGECGLVMIDNQTLFVTRTSQNYFHSYGNPSSGSTQILIERAGDAVTLVRIDPSIEGDETIVKKDFGEPRELLAEWFKKTGFSF